MAQNPRRLNRVELSILNEALRYYSGANSKPSANASITCALANLRKEGFLTISLDFDFERVKNVFLHQTGADH